MHTLSSHRVTPELLAEMFQAATGISMDVQKLRRAGERVINLERMFNVHQGLGRADDTLPSRFFEEIPGGPGKGRKINRKRFDQLLQEFYHLRGWSANGIPTFMLLSKTMQKSFYTPSTCRKQLLPISKKRKKTCFTGFRSCKMREKS